MSRHKRPNSLGHCSKAGESLKYTDFGNET